MPDKPFFMYFAPGATHAPHHVPKEWSDKYKGKFDDGWDTLAGERSLPGRRSWAWCPQDAELTSRHDEIPALGRHARRAQAGAGPRRWSSTPASSSRPTIEVGRVIDAIDDLGVLDDTLIYYIIGDNGASAEGTLNGCFNEMTTLNGMPGIETTEFLLSKIDDFGTPKAYNHYAVGWAHALCTPYQWTKQVASHWGGTRNGTIVHWPNGLARRASCATSSITSSTSPRTILEAAGLPEPAWSTASRRRRWKGSACCRTLRDGDAPETHDVQYFEMFGNRGIYHQGWTAVTKHRTPWKADQPPPFDDDVWELYAPDDWTQAHDLAASNPKKLAELQRLWLIEAVKYNVVPLDDRGFERINPDIAGRPQLIRGNTQLLFAGCGSARTASSP